jgi:hypothetical protein
MLYLSKRQGMKTEKNITDALKKDLLIANDKIIELENKIKILQENEISFPMRLWMALEAILEKEFHNPKPTELKVINLIDENETVEVNANEIICIIPETKGRRKIIYLKQNEIIKKYFFNNNNVNFSTLCKQIDPLNRYLLKASKSAIVNVGYYDLSKNKLLQLNIKSKELNSVKPIKTSASNDFLKIKHGIEYRISLQKRVLGYKSSNNIVF